MYENNYVLWKYNKFSSNTLQRKTKSNISNCCVAIVLLLLIIRTNPFPFDVYCQPFTFPLRRPLFLIKHERNARLKLCSLPQCPPGKHVEYADAVKHPDQTFRLNYLKSCNGLLDLCQFYQLIGKRSRRIERELYVK